jgi:hypothetical protein
LHAARTEQLEHARKNVSKMFVLLRFDAPFLCMMPLPSAFSLHIHKKGRQYLREVQLHHI